MMRTELKEELLAAAPGKVRFDEPMRLHTSFHIGGPAEIWAEPQDPEQLRKLLAIAADAGLKVTMVGGGANLLVRDEGVPGLVVHLSGAGFREFRATEEGVVVGAGLPLEWLIRKAQEASLSGVEFLAGVPGHVGGAVRMNAGTHDDAGTFHHFGDKVKTLKVMDLAGNVKTIPADAAGFSYRNSNLNGRIVLETLLRLTPDDSTEIFKRVQRLWEFKKRTQDWSAPSVGCIFKNPVQTPVPGTGTVPGTDCFRSAGWFVDQAGLKGLRVGGAAVSDKHANFILNGGNAKAADVLAIVDEAKARVLKQFGVQLELEVQLLP